MAEPNLFSLRQFLQQADEQSHVVLLSPSTSLKVTFAKHPGIPLKTSTGILLRQLTDHDGKHNLPISSIY